MGDFSGKFLKNESFEEMDLRNSNFYGASIYNCNFRLSMLDGSCMKSTKIKNSNFFNASMIKVDISNSWLEKVTLDRSVLLNLISIESIYKECTFIDAYSERANFLSSVFNNCIVSDMYLDEAILQYIKVLKTDFLKASCLPDNFHPEYLKKPKKKIKWFFLVLILSIVTAKIINEKGLKWIIDLIPDIIYLIKRF